MQRDAKSTTILKNCTWYVRPHSGSDLHGLSACSRLAQGGLSWSPRRLVTSADAWTHCIGALSASLALPSLLFLGALQTLKGREVALIRSVNETHTKCCEPLKEHVGVIDSLNAESKRLIRLAKANLSPVCFSPGLVWIC